MSDWTSGYVSDIEYTFGFYRELTPTMFSYISLLKGQKTLRHNFDYCELGCGQGLSMNLLAAANPQGTFYATDFNPSQIAGASALADSARLKNVHFYDQSFEEFVSEDTLPEKFDIISLHGIYSWVSEENRRHIIRFLETKLRPGGLVYISYNTLPGWAAAAPIRHLMRFAADSAAGDSANKVDAGLRFLSQILSAGPRYFHANPGLTERAENLGLHNRNYLAHEYLNSDWNLFYHSDVAKELAAARLSFLCSAAVLEQVDEVNLTTSQRDLLRGTADSSARETLRDYIVNQQFRRDIFCRGAARLPPNEVRELWLDSRFALLTPREDVPMKVQGALGEATLQQEVYAPILDAFSARILDGLSASTSLREVLEHSSQVAALSWLQVRQAIMVLVGSGHLQPCPTDADGENDRRESARRFNTAVLERAQYTSDIQFLAVPVTGGGIAVDRFSQLFLLAHNTEENDPVDFAWRLLDLQGQKIVKEGKALESVDENVGELRRRYVMFQQRLPLLRSLGVAE